MTEPLASGTLPLSVNQFMVPDLPLAELARWCRDRRVPGLGLLRGAVQELGPVRVAATLRDHGVVPTSVCVALGLIDAEPDRQAALVAGAIRDLERAAELGVPLVVVVGGPAPGLHLDEARRRAAEQVRRLGARAAALGTSILLEPLHPVLIRHSALTTLAEAAALAATAPATGVVADLWHLWTEPGLAATVAAHPDAVRLVHIADWPAEPDEPDERELPGAGLIDLCALTAQLHAAGFRGWWEIEVLSRRLGRVHPPLDLLDRSLAATRAVLAPIAHPVLAPIAQPVAAAHRAAGTGPVAAAHPSGGGDRHGPANPAGNPVPARTTAAPRRTTEE